MLLVHIVHLLDKQNRILHNALYILQEHNVVANDFLELASRRRCVYVSGFFNDFVTTAKTNFVVYFDRVQLGTQSEI
jgi:UDP-2,3-diacylglucosamine pyrophosphatase LpxH